MPGYDGTGPRGRGPMTGRGNGYCIMQIPNDPGRSGTGFVGLSGTSIAIPPLSNGSESVLSTAQIAGIQNALCVLRRCIDHLETTSRREHGTRDDAASHGPQAPLRDEP